MIFSKKIYFIYILSIISAIVFSYFFLDEKIARYFLDNKDTYEKIGDFLSIFGQSHWYIGAGVIGIIFFKYFKKNELYKNRFLFLFYANVFSGLVSIITKFIFGRIRPWGLKNDGENFGFLLFQNFDLGLIEKLKYQIVTIMDASTRYTSFPSGHSTTIFAMFAFMSLLFPKYKFLWLFISIVFVSGRVLAGDHFISDILAGVLVGTISTIYLYSKMRNKI